MKQQSCSMHLFREGETKTAELGRKRYEELKKDLKGRGYEEMGYFGGDDECIWINDADNDKYLNRFGAFLEEQLTPNFGPLLKYNPPLLLAIAGQRPEGGVGCIIKFYSDLVRLENIEDGFWNGRYLTGSCKGQIVSGAPPHLRDLATIEELIEAFPPTCEENAQVKPEPRKIRNPDAQEIIEDAIKELQELLPVYVNEWVDSSEDEYRTAVEDTKAELFKKWSRRHEQAGEEWINEVINGAKEPRKIRKGDRLLCVDASEQDLITGGNYYIADSNERDGGWFWLINDRGNRDWFLSKRFTLAYEKAKPMKEPDPLRIRMGDDLIFDNTSYTPNSLTYFRQYKALSDEFDDDGQMSVWVIGNDGTKVACLSDCFTLAKEVAAKYKERTHIAIQVERGTLELAISEEGIYTSDECTDVTDFLRYALLRHDQMKQQ